MAETLDAVLRRCNADIVASKKAIQSAAARLAHAERQHREHADAPCDGACSGALALARAEHERAVTALEDATARKENADADAREALGDDPIDPPDSYELKGIIAKLSHFHQRATYEAVGGLFNNSPWYFVVGWLSDDRSREKSFIVDKVTGEPRDYPAHLIHPCLKQRPNILRDSKALLAWLQAHRIPL